MNRIWSLVVAGACALLAVGCPYESELGIGEPGSGVLDSRLCGLWTWIDPAGGAVSQIRVQPFNDAEYLVEYEESGSEVDSSKRELYRAFAVSLGGQEFLQINQLRSAESPPRYLFARYDISDPRTLVLRFVGDRAVPTELRSNATALRDFLRAHSNDAMLDDADGPVRLRRADASGR